MMLSCLCLKEVKHLKSFLGVGVPACHHPHLTCPDAPGLSSSEMAIGPLAQWRVEMHFVVTSDGWCLQSPCQSIPFCRSGRMLISRLSHLPGAGNQLQSYCFQLLTLREAAHNQGGMGAPAGVSSPQHQVPGVPHA